MKVRMLTLAASAEGVFEPGMVRDVTEKIGKALIDGRYAEKCDGKHAIKETSDDPDVAPISDATIDD